MSGGPKYVKDFTFPSDFGFTGSAGQVGVRPHSRQPPRFAEGGKVDVKKITGAQITEDEAKRLEKAKPPPQPVPEKKASLVDILRGKTRRQQEQDLGLKKGGKVKRMAGGRMCKAMGGPVKAAKGGDIAQDKRLIKQELGKHIRAPKPRGHGVK